MPARDSLQCRKIEGWIVVDNAIVETQYKRLKLRDDTVLIVARVADQCTGWIGTVTRKVERAIIERIAKQEFRAAVVVHVGLVAGTAPIDIIEIQRRGAEVR
jgi:hypothetical protein